MNTWNQNYNEGYAQGRLEAKIELAMECIINPKSFHHTMDEMIARGTFTEFQRQQALFYLRLDINIDDSLTLK